MGEGVGFQWHLWLEALWSVQRHAVALLEGGDGDGIHRLPFAVAIVDVAIDLVGSIVIRQQEARMGANLEVGLLVVAILYRPDDLYFVALKTVLHL